MTSTINSTTILIFAFAFIVSGQEQYSWKPEDSTAVFVDSGSGFTFCYPEHWIIKKRQTDKPDRTCLWLELFDCDFNNPMNKGLDKIEHTYYVALIPHMTTSAETWSKKDITASNIKKIKTKSKSIIECVLTDTTSGVYNGSLSRVVRYVENNYGVEIKSFSFSQFDIPFLHKIANSIQFTKIKTTLP